MALCRKEKFRGIEKTKVDGVYEVLAKFKKKEKCYIISDNLEKLAIEFAGADGINSYIDRVFYLGYKDKEGIIRYRGKFQKDFVNEFPSWQGQLDLADKILNELCLGPKQLFMLGTGITKE